MGDRWFDTRRLEEWLGLHLGRGGGAPHVLSVGRIQGGFSAETYRITVAWPDSNGGMPKELLLRRDPPAGPVERDIRREYAAMQALCNSPIPVPRVFRLEMDSRWLERPFF